MSLTTRFANPGQFFASRVVAYAVVCGIERVFIRRRTLPRAFSLAAGLPAGRDGAHHVHPCACRVDGDDDLRRDGRGGGRGPCRAPCAGGCVLRRGRAGGRCARSAVPCDRQHLGPSDLGRVVGMGCAADKRFSSSSSLIAAISCCAGLSTTMSAASAPARFYFWSAR